MCTHAEETGKDKEECMFISIKNCLGVLFLLLICGCGNGASDDNTASAPEPAAAYSTVSTPVGKTYGIFTDFTSARALSFTVSGIKLAHVNTRGSSLMAVNTEQNNIAIISMVAWPYGDPIVTFDGEVSGEIVLSHIELLNDQAQSLPPQVEVRAIK